MSTACNRQRSRIESAAWGRLDEGARAELLAHSAGCPDCARTLEFMERLRRERDGEARTLPPAVYFEGVLAEIHARMPRTVKPRPRVRPRLRVSRESFASGIMLTLTLGWFGAIWSARERPHDPTAPLPSPVQPAPPSAAQLAQTREAERRAEVVFVAHLGWLRRDSELLRLSPRELSELGLIAAENARG